MLVCKILTMLAPSPVQAAIRPLLILGSAAILLWLVFFCFPSPSERFHAILVPIWLLNSVLARRRLDKRSIILDAGLLLGLVGFYAVGPSPKEFQVAIAREPKRLVQSITGLLKFHYLVRATVDCTSQRASLAMTTCCTITHPKLPK
jgi:hypothetical protein